MCRFEMDTANNLDWRKVTIAKTDLIDWLIAKGSAPAFFADAIQERKDAIRQGRAVLPSPVQQPAAPAYLNRAHPRYASKLAAAVRAWEATRDMPGKSPKQVIKEWLRTHAAEFDLFNQDGTPNETGIDEIAKIANWQSQGGVPKTPG